MSRSVSLLVSTLVRYPEIGTVKYEPKLQTLRLSLLITGECTEEDWEGARQTLTETLDVYHMLEQRRPTVLEVVRESYGELTTVSITRDAVTFTPEEIYTIVEFFRERFTGRLVTELMDWAGEDEMAAQDEMIEEMLADLEDSRSGHNLIAIREDGRVMVFQK